MAIKILMGILLQLSLLHVGWQSEAGETKYVFYDVNPGEGFNLRRDVFMRMAVFVKKLNDVQDDNYVLVLPPWGRLYHWQSRHLGEQVKIPWKQFFDLESIKRYAPVIDLEDYLAAKEDPVIDLVLYLQGYKEGWKAGEFVEKFDYRDCIDGPRYHKEEETGLYRGWFFGYEEMRARDFKCLSVQGTTRIIRDHIIELNKKSFFLDRGESLIHDWFGDIDYWASRRSMRFAKPLVEIANEFRRKELDSDDERDTTKLAPKWEDQRPERGTAKGGPYLCVHLRRNDYLRSRKDQLPSLKGAAKQIEDKLKEFGLKTVFVSTDAPINEFNELKTHVASDIKVTKYIPDEATHQKYKDGGVAIIDQSICSHARYFLGSPESTFTFRIQEEREIMGFTVDQTFGMMCPDGKVNCEKGSVWKIVYPDENKSKKSSGHSEL